MVKKILIILIVSLFLLTGCNNMTLNESDCDQFRMEKNQSCRIDLSSNTIILGNESSKYMLGVDCNEVDAIIYTDYKLDFEIPLNLRLFAGCNKYSKVKD